MVRLSVSGSGDCGEGADSSPEVWYDDSVVVEPVRSGSGARVVMDSTGGDRGMMGSGAVSGSLASMMETTIFSSSSEVMWRSRPRLRLLAHESCLCILGRTISTGLVSALRSTASSSATESTLPDSCGRSSAVALRGYWMSCGWVVQAEMSASSPSQQKVSRFHSRQLRFSSRLPWATESRHLAKTGAICGQHTGLGQSRVAEEPDSPVHMLKRLAGLVVSTLWMTFASTWRTGASKVIGMMTVGCSIGRAGPECRVLV